MKHVPSPKGSDNESSLGNQTWVGNIPGDDEVVDEPRTPSKAKHNPQRELVMPHTSFFILDNASTYIFLVVINFYNPYNKEKQPREVWMPNQNFERVPISIIEKGDRMIYSTSLTKLLQATIEEESPIKGMCSSLF